MNCVVLSLKSIIHCDVLNMIEICWIIWYERKPWLFGFEVENKLLKFNLLICEEFIGLDYERLLVFI